MFRKQIPFFITLCLLLCAVNELFSETKTITLGGKDGWKSLSYRDSIVSGTGRFGYESLLLATASSRLSPETDMLLSFENNEVSDAAENYTVINQNMDFSTKAVMGKGAAMNRGGSSNGIRLRGSKNSLFGSAGLTGSFVIEFWLCPSISENGEQFFNWRSSRILNDHSMYQIIRGSFFNNHIEWVFDNIFGTEENVLDEIILTSVSSIIPQKWALHTLSYDDQTGLLEYRINGTLEAVTYVTDNRKESGEVRNAMFGVPADLELCSQYNGLIDDVQITRESYTEHRRSLFSLRGGRFESQPLETIGFHSTLVSLNAVTTIPAETDIAFYVRGGDNFYEWTPEEPAWVPIIPGQKINGVQGKYFQIAAELYPDGNGIKSPSVSEIMLQYIETVPPLPPASVRAVSGNGYVDLTWSSSVDFSVGGYTVYYGERPGEYLGSIAVEGNSPLDVGNVQSCRLSGLTNGRIYYFAVSAYSSQDTRISGVLSKEVYARPLRKTK